MPNLNPTYVVEQYVKRLRSPADIAAELKTNTNAIRRLLLRLGVTLRNHSKAQKNAIKTGKHPGRWGDTKPPLTDTI